MRVALILLLLAGCVHWSRAQTIGTVTSPDATVTVGTARVMAAAQGRMTLTGPATVTAAAEHSATIALTRGG